MAKVRWTFAPSSGHVREGVPWTAQRSRTAKRRLRMIEARSVMNAIRRISVWQTGETRGNTSYRRASSIAHRYRAGLRCAGAADASCGSAAGVTGSASGSVMAQAVT